MTLYDLIWRVIELFLSKKDKNKSNESQDNKE